MQKLPDLGPELGAFTDNDGTVHKAYGGIRRLPGSEIGYFALAWSEEPSVGLIGFGTAKSSGLTHFPEFDDLALLTRSDESGEPIGAEAEGWRLLTLEADSFSASAVARLFRIAPAEAIHLLRDVMAEIDALCDRTGVERQEAVDQVRAGFYADWIAEQRPRWKAEAESAILAHDLIVFGG